MDEEYDVIVLGTGLTVSSRAASGCQRGTVGTSSCTFDTRTARLSTRNSQSFLRLLVIRLENK